MLFNLLVTLIIISGLFSLNGKTDYWISDFNKGVDIQISGDKVKAQEDYPTRKLNRSLGIKTTAKAVIVLDQGSGKILFEKNSGEVLAVASLTKLMTALVFLEEKPDFEKVFSIKKQEEIEGGRLYLSPGEKVTIENLFYTSLVGSANNTTLALVRSVELGKEEFIKRMNEKAKDLGLYKTHFIEPTGVDPGNTSTAYEAALLLKEALKNPLIQKATSMKEYSFQSLSGRRHRIKNTNKLVSSYLNIQGGKTGFINEANFCLASQIRGEEGKKIIVVVLGSATSEDRFQEVKGLIEWTFENWEW